MRNLVKIQYCKNLNKKYIFDKGGTLMGNIVLHYQITD